ncbi:MAG: hypothetical protein ACP5D6_06260 [Kosmotogaceae bacterium]
MYVNCDLAFTVPENQATEAVKRILETLSAKLLLGARGDSLNIRASDKKTVEITISALKGKCSFEDVLERINEYMELITFALKNAFGVFDLTSSFLYPDGEYQNYTLC